MSRIQRDYVNPHGSLKSLAKKAEEGRNLKIVAWWTVGIFLLLVVGLALYVGRGEDEVTTPETTSEPLYTPKSHEEIKAEVARRAAQKRVIAGRQRAVTPSIDLDIEVTGCSTSHGYTTTEGYVENTGDVTVHFLTVETRWQDAGGNTVDTGWTYAVGSESLRPGERSTFTDSTRHSGARRCSANIQDYRRVGR